MFGHKCTELLWFCESKNVLKMQRKHTIVRIIYTRHIMTLFMNKASVMHTLCFTVITAQKYLNMRILEARPLRATHQMVGSSNGAHNSHWFTQITHWYFQITHWITLGSIQICSSLIYPNDTWIATQICYKSLIHPINTLLSQILIDPCQ